MQGQTLKTWAALTNGHILMIGKEYDTAMTVGWQHFD
jgi:hypothetical protein